MNVETFAPLRSLSGIRHAFTLRTIEDTRDPGFQERFAPGAASAEQTHGDGVAVVKRPGHYPGVDALVTGERNLPLVIRVADCAAVFIVDRQTPAIGLIHSGKKGTQLNITGATIAAMRDRLGTKAGDCVAFISPSIGPCHYEVDIWSGIESQLRAAGVSEVYNHRVCTACHLDRYFSYRAEHGQTGRHFALLSQT